MTGVSIAIALGLTALIIVGVILGRQNSKQRKLAVASLEAERAAIGNPTILDLVIEEVEELGLRDIDGADDIEPDALLRTWKAAPESIRAHEPGDLRIATGASGDDIRLVASGPDHDSGTADADPGGPSATAPLDDDTPDPTDPGDDHV